MLLAGLAATPVCSQGEQIDEALTVLWERRPCAQSFAVTDTPVKVS